jgi:hypothetical protein
MCPLDSMRCSSSILKLTFIPLLAVTLVEWTAFPLRAATDSYHRTVITSDSGRSDAKSSAQPRISLKVQGPLTGPKSGRSHVSQTAPSEAGASESQASEQVSPESADSSVESVSENESVTVPKSSAIIVSFPTEIMLDPKRQNNVPITLPLVRPIVDLEGNVVVPAKSLVSAQLKPMKGGDLVEVIALVIGGRVIPINAIGTLVPAQKKPEDFSNQYVPNPGPLNNVFNSLSNWQLSSTYLNLNKNAQLNDYIGIGLAVANGLTTPKPKNPPAYVSISQGTIYILTLATPFSIPKKLVDTGIQLEQNVEANGSP